MKKSSLLLLTAVLCGYGASAHAEPTPAPAPTQADVDDARRRFQRGVELYREGSFDSALAEFNKAYQLAPNYRILYNIAQVQTERHDYITAAKLLDQYLREGGNDITAERHAQVEEEARALRTRIAQLVATVNVDGAELLVDGVSVGELPLKAPLPLNSGLRRLQARKDGYRTSMRTLTVAGNESVSVDFDLQPDPTAARASAALYPEGRFARTEESSSPINTPMWISLTATGALGAGAVAFGLMTRSANDKLDTQLDRFPGDKNAIEDARDKVKRDALITDAFIAASAITGGLTIYFALTPPSKSPEADKSAATRPGVFLRAAGSGLRLDGRF